MVYALAAAEALLFSTLIDNNVVPVRKVELTTPKDDSALRHITLKAR